MIIFLHGEDSYRRKKKADELILAYAEKNPNSSLDYFDVENKNEFLSIKSFLENRSLFGGKKLAILKGLFEEKVEADFFKKFLKSDDELILILADDIKKGWSFLLKEPVISQKFELLQGEKLKIFIQKEIEERGYKIDTDAMSVLVRLFKKDTWGLIQEIEKLFLLKKEQILLKDIISITGRLEEADIFSFINGVRFKRKPLFELEKLLSSAEDSAKIFNILASMESRLAGEMAGYDVAIKSGRMDYEEALVLIALKS